MERMKGGRERQICPCAELGDRKRYELTDEHEANGLQTTRSTAQGMDRAEIDGAQQLACVTAAGRLEIRAGRPTAVREDSINSGAPCGACKFLRRKCVDGCIFAPYFGSEQGAARFAAVHKIFGASNVSKLLQRIPPPKRCDAVLTISYEAQARISDPVYGCISTIVALQQQVASLQAELNIVRAHLANSRQMAVSLAMHQQHHHTPAALLSPAAAAAHNLPFETSLHGGHVQHVPAANPVAFPMRTVSLELGATAYGKEETPGRSDPMLYDISVAAANSSPSDQIQQGIDHHVTEIPHNLDDEEGSDHLQGFAVAAGTPFRLTWPQT